MRVAVLGSSGAMGSYFVRRFLESGHTVTGHDPRKSKLQPGLLLANSNALAVREAGVVLISVPIVDTVKVGREIAPHLKVGSVLLEIASLKTGVHDKLIEALGEKRVRLISVHPMFGPRSTSPKPKILVLGGPRELAVTRSIFPWAQLIAVNEKAHDRTMAYALNMVHLLNLAFVSALSKRVGIQEFAKVSSPLGTAQLTIAEAVLSQDPSLYSLIQLANPFAADALSSFIRELQSLTKIVRDHNHDEFERRFSSMSREFPRADLRNALDTIYASFD